MRLTREQEAILKRNGFVIIIEGADDKWNNGEVDYREWIIIGGRRGHLCYSWEDCLVAIVEERMDSSG